MTSPSGSRWLCQHMWGAQGSPSMGHGHCSASCCVQCPHSVVAAGWQRCLDEVQQPHWGGSLHLPNSPLRRVLPKVAIPSLEYLQVLYLGSSLKCLPWKGICEKFLGLVRLEQCLGIVSRAHKTEKMVRSKAKYLVNALQKHSLFYHHWPAWTHRCRSLFSRYHAWCCETHANVLALKWKIPQEQFWSWARHNL